MFEFSSAHHAYLFIGERSSIIDFVKTILAKRWGIVVHGNPDFLVIERQEFFVEDSRRLTQWALRKPLKDKKISVVAVNTMTAAAQNALLKIFEEPPPDTHFFLIAPTAEIFLPTLLSRLIIQTFPKEKKTQISSQRAADFFTASLADRFSLIKDFSEATIGQEGSDIAKAVDFLAELELFLADWDSHKFAFCLGEIIAAKKRLAANVGGVKMNLEHIAMVLPTRDQF